MTDLARRSTLGLVAGAFTMPRLAHASGGELRIGMTAADIPTGRGAPDQGGEGIRWMGFTIHDALVYWDLSQKETIPEIIPALAERYYPNPENSKEWIFELRRGAKFYDSSDFDADAVIWKSFW